MYENFTQYWEAKKEVYKSIGVSKEAAKMIWSDAADCLAIQLIIKQIK